MYYVALRNFNPSETRSKELAPFLTIFDDDPNGDVTEYMPERFRAACLMVIVLNGGEFDPVVENENAEEEAFREVMLLWPDWFYPYVLRATNIDDMSLEFSQDNLQRAESLAASDLQRQLVADYRQSQVERIAKNKADGTPCARDTRPMTEGNARRAKIAVLRPNESVLRRLASGG